MQQVEVLLLLISVLHSQELRHSRVTCEHAICAMLKIKGVNSLSVCADDTIIKLKTEGCG